MRLARIRNFVRCRWLRWRWGIAGDGITDDTAPLQRYVDSHVIARFPPGIYVVGETVNLIKNNKMEGTR